jgi:hypothetical protein
MSEGPPIIAVLLLAVFTGWMAFTCYKAWFDIEGLRQFYLRLGESFPDWYPLSRLVTRFIQTNWWKWQIRLTTTILTIIFVPGTVIAVVVYLQQLWAALPWPFD